MTSLKFISRVMQQVLLMKTFLNKTKTQIDSTKAIQPYLNPEIIPPKSTDLHCPPFKFIFK